MKQAIQQLVTIWKELGINQKVSLSLAALVVVGGMIGLLVWAQRPQMKLLYGKLGEKEAAEVVEALTEANVPYELGANGTSVFVKSDQVYKARMDLAAKGLPSGDGVGFEIFDRTNFGISDFVQRTNYGRAVQGELARTIAQLRGVKSARVIVVMPESRLVLLRGDDSRPTASVFVDTGGLTLDTSAVSSIRSLVANAVEGLRADDVAVVDNHGNVLSEELNTDPQLGTASSQIRFKQQTEQYLADKVETMLARVLGPGNSVVRVSADISTEFSTLTEEKYDPEGQVARSETAVEDNTTTIENGGTQPASVGVTANVPVDQQSQAAAANDGSKNTQTTKLSKTHAYEINRSTMNVTKNPGTIERITAAVIIATQPTAEGMAATPRTPEQMEDLRAMVANALGIAARSPQELSQVVSITEMPFPTVVTAAGVSTDFLSGYSEYIGPIGALLLATILFVIFFRLLRSTKPDEVTFELLEDDAAPVEEAGPILPQRKEHKISPQLLNDLIRQKPDNVGATIRDWLGHRSAN